MGVIRRIAEQCRDAWLFIRPGPQGRCRMTEQEAHDWLRERILDRLKVTPGRDYMDILMPGGDYMDTLKSDCRRRELSGLYDALALAGAGHNARKYYKSAWRTDFSILAHSIVSQRHTYLIPRDALAHAMIIAQSWIDSGRGVNHRDFIDRTPLHSLVSARTVDFPRVFIKAGADVNARDIAGRTPIFYAKTCDMAQYLIQCGADPSLLDCNAMTAVDVIKARFDYEVGGYEYGRCYMSTDDMEPWRQLIDYLSAREMHAYMLENTIQAEDVSTKPTSAPIVRRF